MYEIDFLPVGKGGRHGDAIAMRFTKPDGGLAHVILDAGFEENGQALRALARERTEQTAGCRYVGGYRRRVPPSHCLQKLRRVELTDWRLFLENTNTDYKRKRPVAVINAQDVDEPADLTRPGASTLIKMSQVGLEGLKQAFVDPESRIRLASDPIPEERTEFRAIEWTGGFLDELGLRLNENLNVLVGGPGSGKSTIIESIRYVLDLQPIGTEARKTHQSIVNNVLRPGTQISLLLYSPHPAPREYLIERTVPNPPTVRDDAGNIIGLLPRDVASRVEVYGQHEVSEIARSPEERTRLLERFLDTDEVDAERDRIVRNLPGARERLLAATARGSEIEDELAALPGFTETLKRYEDAGLETRLKEKSQVVHEDALLMTAVRIVEGLAQRLRQVEAALPISRDFLAVDALEGLPNREALAKLDPILEKVSTAVEAEAATGLRAVEDALKAIDQVKAERAAGVAEIESKYQKTLRDLQKTNVDGEEFIQLRQRIERLQPLRDERQKIDDEIAEARTARAELIVKLEEARAAGFRELERASKRVSRQLTGRVRVSVEFQGNREPLFDLLRRRASGRLSEAIEALRTADNLSLRALADSCRAGAVKFAEAYRIPPGQASRIVELGEPLFMAIEELDLPATTELELNIAPASATSESWQRLDDLSAGQKATAVLLLLLLESDAPLVIDQPEDDLDNRFITDGIVPKMREEKRRRQFIFSTHNANIPVLGDAELIAGLSATGEAPHGHALMRREDVGSIDVDSVCKLVEDLLEGGEDAFELRRLKYGINS